MRLSLDWIVHNIVLDNVYSLGLNFYTSIVFAEGEGTTRSAHLLQLRVLFRVVDTLAILYIRSGWQLQFRFVSNQLNSHLRLIDFNFLIHLNISIF